MDNLEMAFKIAVGLVVGLMMFIIRRAFTKIDENTKQSQSLEKELSEHKIDVAKNYVGKDDLSDLKGEIFKRFDKSDDRAEQFHQKIMSWLAK